METTLAVAIGTEFQIEVVVSSKLFSREGVLEVMLFCKVNRVPDKAAEGHNSHAGTFSCLQTQATSRPLSYKNNVTQLSNLFTMDRERHGGMNEQIVLKSLKFRNLIAFSSRKSGSQEATSSSPFRRSD